MSREMTQPRRSGVDALYISPVVAKHSCRCFRHLTCRIRDRCVEITHLDAMLGHQWSRTLMVWRHWVDYFPFYMAIASFVFVTLFYGTHDEPYGHYPPVSSQSQLTGYVE